MIDRIIVRNFKSLRGVDLTLGRMNLLIGANASGKSNFLEVPRVLQGIGKGLTIPEVLDGVLDEANASEWQGIRGGSAKVCSAGDPGSAQGVTIEAHGRLGANISRGWEFEITFSPESGRVVREALTMGSEVVYSIENSAAPYMAQIAEDSKRIDLMYPHTRVQEESGESGKALPNLNQIPLPSRQSFQQEVFHQPILRNPAISDPAMLVARSLANVQRVDPWPNLLRERCTAPRIGRMGNHGKAFMALIRTICQDEKTKDRYLSWMREFSSPAGNDVIDALSSLNGDPSSSSVVDSSAELSALGDGTLRFTSLVAAFFQPDMPELMLIDEIETSIHASRIRLLVELLSSQSECTPTQVIATSHSPVVLEWLRDEGLANVFFCNRDEITGETMIRSLLEIPHLERSIKERDFFDMLTEGWLESVS